MGCAEGQSPFAGSLRVSLRYNFPSFLVPGRSLKKVRKNFVLSTHRTRNEGRPLFG